MTDYIRKSTTVQAYLFGGQPQAQWPEWLREHKIATNMGIVPPALAHGVLLIPQQHGPTINVVSGQTVVLERGVLTRYKAEEFAELFVSADAEPETPAATPAPAPAVETKSAAEKKPAKAKDETPAETPAATDAE